MSVHFKPILYLNKTFKYGIIDSLHRTDLHFNQVNSYADSHADFESDAPDASLVQHGLTLHPADLPASASDLPSTDLTGVDTCSQRCCSCQHPVASAPFVFANFNRLFKVVCVICIKSCC